MVSLPSHFSSRRPARTELENVARLGACIVALAICSACGRAENFATPAGQKVAADSAAAEPSSLCRPSDQGYLRARLQGSIDTELDWTNVPQCLGAPRPSGDGVRLLFKGPSPSSPGTTADAPGLLIVIGAGPLQPGESRRQVPANLTVIREGSGEFFATQGDDKCALDDVTQQAIEPERHRFRLTARGYCTQPARAVRGDGAVLVSRFDVESIVDFSETAPPPTLAEYTR
jgi:hypothetical protein